MLALIIIIINFGLLVYDKIEERKELKKMIQNHRENHRRLHVKKKN
jgi:hypothetical protein